VAEQQALPWFRHCLRKSPQPVSNLRRTPPAKHIVLCSLLVVVEKSGGHGNY